MPDELFFTLFADPKKDGTGSTVVDQLSSLTLHDDVWDNCTYSTGMNAMAPSGNYFYRLEIQWKDPASADDSNEFKLRADGQVCMAMDRFGFIGAPMGGKDPIVGSGDTNPGAEMNDPGANSYDGNWTYYFYVPSETAAMTFRDGDADSGNDTDSPETPDFDPDGAGPAVGEGANPGKPADDGGSNPGANVPGNIIYSIIEPGNVEYTNYNPSGNCEWENFTITGLFSNGIYEMHWKYMDAHNAIYMVPPYEIYADPVIPLPVLNIPPVAEAGPDLSTTVGATVSFDGTGSYDPDGTIVNWTWAFGDGTTGWGACVDHVYASKGTMVAVLAVTDNMGGTATDTVAITVVNLPPVADAGADISGTVITACTFDGSGSYDPDGSIVKYAWDFGDGTDGNGMIASHTYASKGTFTATLAVTDDDGAVASDSLIVRIVNLPPVAKSQGDISTFVRIACSMNGLASYDPDGRITQYIWSFGDGKRATGPSVSHIYSVPGTYSCTLTVVDNDGATAIEYFLVTALPLPIGMEVPVDAVSSDIFEDGLSGPGGEPSAPLINTGSVGVGPNPVISPDNGNTDSSPQNGGLVDNTATVPAVAEYAPPDSPGDTGSIPGSGSAAGIPVLALCILFAIVIIPGIVFYSYRKTALKKKM
jgi:PKD repeat protein